MGTERRLVLVSNILLLQAVAAVAGILAVAVAAAGF